MAPLESLPPDQRAVLQLVLQRGRSYDEIAAMLSIDRAAVRDRALSAFDALGPPTRIPAERRALIVDYLMGQLPPRVAEQIFARLGSSPAERAWARALAADLTPIARNGLPEIPASIERAAPAPPPLPAPTPTVEDPQDVVPPATAPASPPRPRRRPAPTTPPAAAPAPPAGSGDEDDAAYGRRDRDAVTASTVSAGGADNPPPSSRRGGAIMIAGALVVVLVVIVLAIVLTNNGGSSHSNGTVAQTTPAQQPDTGTSPQTGTVTTPATTPAGISTATSTTPASTSAAGAATGGTGTTGPPAKLVAQIDLKSPTGATSPVGVAQVVSKGSQEGIVLVATGVTPNTKHNAYAVWLYNSPTNAVLLGFVNPAVGSTGKLETAGVLPKNVSSYHRVLVTLESQPKPKQPGTIILSGPLVIKK